MVSLFYKVISSLKKALQPSVSGVELKFSVPAGVEVLQAPSKIPPVFNGEKLVLYGWLKGGAGKSGQGTAVLRGKTLGSDVEHSIDFQLGGKSPSSDTPIVHQLAAKSLIQDWQSSEKEKSERKAAIIKLSIESSVVSCHTSYVAVDEDQDKPIEGAIKTYDLTATSAPSYLRTSGLGLGYRGRNCCKANPLFRGPQVYRCHVAAREDYTSSGMFNVIFNKMLSIILNYIFEWFR